MTPPGLYELVLEAIRSADCHCPPGDGTCEDWVSEGQRHDRLARVVSNRLTAAYPALVAVPGRTHTLEPVLCTRHKVYGCVICHPENLPPSFGARLRPTDDLGLRLHQVPLLTQAECTVARGCTSGPWSADHLRECPVGDALAAHEEATLPHAPCDGDVLHTGHAYTVHVPTTPTPRDDLPRAWCPGNPPTPDALRRTTHTTQGTFGESREASNGTRGEGPQAQGAAPMRVTTYPTGVGKAAALEDRKGGIPRTWWCVGCGQARNAFSAPRPEDRCPVCGTTSVNAGGDSVTRAELKRAKWNGDHPDGPHATALAPDVPGTVEQRDTTTAQEDAV